MSYIISREELKRLHPQWEPKIAPVEVAPQYDRVLCWRVAEEEKTRGGLIVPVLTTTLRARAVILAYGLGAADTFYNHDTRLGDVVTFAEFAGNDKMTTTASGEDGQRAEFLWLNAADILGNESLAARLKAGTVEPVSQVIEVNGRTKTVFKLADVKQAMPTITDSTGNLDRI